MKKQELFNIKYNGRTIYKNLNYEESAQILEELALKYYEGEDIDPSFIELESI